MDNAILALSAQELGELIKNGDVSPVELTTAHLEEIERTNAENNVFITVSADSALRQAETAEQEIRNGCYRGPLHGIPFSCKDLFCTKDIRTTGGSRVLEDNVPDYNATVISYLFRSGAVLLGKTNMHEFAYGATGENPYYGTVKNPCDSKRNAGGSSSGSAASVALGTSVFSLGTDTGGSVRAPSALCGVVGLKPTYGLISLSGVLPYCWSLDHFGLSAKSVHDAATVQQVVTGQVRCGADTTADLSVKKPRIGIPRNFFYEYTEDAILERTEEIIEKLKDYGCEIREVEFPNLDYSRTVSLLIQLPEFLSYHSRYLAEKRELYGTDLLAGMAVGQFILAEHYVRAKRIAVEYRNQTERLFQNVDILLTPSCPITAPLVEEVNITTGGKTEAKGNGITRFTSFFNISGNPALTVPSGRAPNGLPMGVQLVGKHFSEDVILHAGRIVETIVHECANNENQR